MQQLPKNTLLQGGKYKIEKVLGQGGFGITYLATQELLDRKVCIKEFFFKEYCERDEETSHVSLGTQSNHEIVERFMNKFLKEARTISQLDHRNIIKIHDIFKENNTAYYVMDYVKGESLSEMVSRRGALPEKEAVAYIERVADALKYIHQQNINHLDIKPSNIMIRQGDYRVILIDFGLSKQYDAQGGQTSTTPVGISHGYAPMEQYKQGGVSTFSPQTDIYALGATLYKLVTGNTPPQAMDILDEGLPSLPSSLSSSVAEKIKKAMQPRKVDRPKSIDEFMDGLSLSLQNSSFVQYKTNSQQNLAIDEETMPLELSNVKSVKNKDESSQLQMKSDNVEQSNDGGRRFKYILYLILACFIFIILLKTCVGNGEISSPPIVVQTKSAQELYQEALKYDEANYNKAIPLFVEASNLGYADASLQLGWCYENGKGVTKNARTAFEWYLKAAAQGSVIAEYNLGYCYYDGVGVSKNMYEAIKHWKIAADQNNVYAQYCLGACYYNGEGVVKNLEEAKKWLEKAANQGDKDAIELLDLIKSNSTNMKATDKKASDKNNVTQGKVTLSDGTYEGQLKNGVPHGKGVCKYYNGSVYDGSWKNGKKSGWGSYKWTDGTKYVGYWKDDKFDDVGTLYEADGSVRWENFQEKQSSSKSKSKIVIEGYVGDINGPVIGASVFEKGTNNGTVTDFNGRFSFTASSDAIICAYFVGYKVRESAAQKNMSFMLVEE